MKKYRKPLLIVFLLISCVFVGVYGFTYAKYISNSVFNYYLQSKGFYFNSDYLNSNSVKNIDNNWNGGSVYFNVKNNLNDTVITSYDINYVVTCSISGDAASYAECHLNGTDTNTYNGTLSSFQACRNNTDDGVDVSSLDKTNCEMSNYNWVNEIANKNLYFDVVSNDENIDVTDVVVNITASSTSPYNKELSGRFILHKSEAIEEILTKYNSYSDYDQLVVTNSHNEEKCIILSWNTNDLLLDTTRENFISNGTNSNGFINSIKINLPAKSNKAYNFYKTNFSKILSESDFSIVEESC